MNDKWLDRYFDLASHVAAWSKDPTTKVGAVIVGKDRRNIALGYNGAPPGVADDLDMLLDKAAKYKKTQHAERAVLDHVQFSCDDATLIVTMFPCSECVKSIISKGIRHIYCPPPVNREPWASDSEWSLLMLGEAKVRLSYRENK